jgi:4-amino-4-deoxy-L-arabinose transferase-like glycosyltransferase
VAATALAAALRFSTLGDQSLWLDEAVTVELLRDDLDGMLRAIASSESTPPLYYLLAWPWAKVFGTGEVGVRALSALLGTATVPVAYAAGTALASRAAGTIAASLVATSPLLVWYSQEARAYSLFVLCGALSFLFFVRALERPSRGALAAWAAASALALASHYFAAFLVAAEFTVLLVVVRRRAAVAAAGSVVAAVGLALLPLAIYQEHGGRTSWIDDTPLGERLGDAAREFVAGRYPLPHIAVVALLLVATAAAFVVRGRPDERRPAVVTAVVGTLTVALPLVLAFAGVDYFLTRNVLVAWVPLVLALAIVLATERARRAGALVAGVLAAGSVAVVAATATRADLDRDDWRAVAETLATRGAKVVVVAPPYERAPLEYYRPGVRSLGPRLVSAREIILIGYPLEDDAFPPRWFQVPTEFRMVETLQLDRIRLVRFRGRDAVPLRATDVGAPGAGSGAVLVDRGAG